MQMSPPPLPLPLDISREARHIISQPGPSLKLTLPALLIYHLQLGRAAKAAVSYSPPFRGRAGKLPGSSLILNVCHASLHLQRPSLAARGSQISTRQRYPASTYRAIDICKDVGCVGCVGYIWSKNSCYYICLFVLEPYQSTGYSASKGAFTDLSRNTP